MQQTIYIVLAGCEDSIITAMRISKLSFQTS